MNQQRRSSAECVRLLVTLIVACTVVISATVPAQARAGTCAGVAHQVDVDGAKVFVNRLFNSPGSRDWESLLAQIESGQPECVRLAKALKPGTDAGSAEGLKITLSRALMTSPAEVLALGDEVYPLNEICQDNDIEPTSKQVRSFLRRAGAALARVHQPALIGRRDACLRSLRS
jgi:hypothetical protein